MTKSEEELSLDDIFEDIRLTCTECRHPRCVSTIKSAKYTIQAHKATRAQAIDAPDNTQSEKGPK